MRQGWNIRSPYPCALTDQTRLRLRLWHLNMRAEFLLLLQDDHILFLFCFNSGSKRIISADCCHLWDQAGRTCTIIPLFVFEVLIWPHLHCSIGSKALQPVDTPLLGTGAPCLTPIAMSICSMGSFRLFGSLILLGNWLGVACGLRRQHCSRPNVWSHSLKHCHK